MACREILLTLYRKGLISLPPGKHARCARAAQALAPRERLRCEMVET